MVRLLNGKLTVLQLKTKLEYMSSKVFWFFFWIYKVFYSPSDFMKKIMVQKDNVVNILLSAAT